MYTDILTTISKCSGKNFDDASLELENCINSDAKFIETLREIGTIPEAIPHDSTEEKLFSKASDAVLARAFREIGLKSIVLKERGDSADVMAESKIHGYTLVADAKAFRMSRTAKNQKDFKIVALSSWRKDADYAVLCSPYFQYPSKTSQIYSQAINNNVCLFSWEHFIFLIKYGIKENSKFSFADFWNFSEKYAHSVLCSDMKKCFIEKFNKYSLSLLNMEQDLFYKLLNEQIEIITERGYYEKRFWFNEIEKIKKYSREEAIQELISSRKINEKITQIDLYMRSLKQ